VTLRRRSRSCSARRGDAAHPPHAPPAPADPARPPPLGAQAAFDAAAARAKTLSGLDNAALLELYKFYKQATEGDNAKPAPGMLDFTGKAKWAAWNEAKGMGKEDAQRAYVAVVERLAGGK